ncbi:MAG: HAD family phosphatase, partial [Lancefieldella rimae]|nr:HAD family phosphatase [Lancefieldella rimae]
MQITGAIFDLDGTLVDSMWMWRRSFGDVLEDLHINMTPDFFKRVEAISLYDGCVACIEEFNLPLSAEELYEKFLVYVQTVYSHDIESIVGAADFLQELFDAGIPLAIASSTPSRAIHVALEAQGMEKFFKAVVCTEDVGGVDKAKPDVYLEALRRLGTDKAHTWVFEDAEFGVHT